MTDKEKIEIGRLRLVGGNRVEGPANLNVIEHRPILSFGGRGKGRLHVLVELSGSALGRSEMAQDLVNAIAEEYMHSPGTITYGLRQAAMLANMQLYRTNDPLSEERRLGGLACLVLRGNEAYLAQAGWPMVYLVHQERVQSFPDTMLEDHDTTMLGQRPAAEVHLFQTTVQPGDTILMVDGPMARQIGSTRIGQIVAGGVEQALNNLETLAPPEDCSAMVIQIGSAPHAEAETEQWAFMPVEADVTGEPEVAAERAVRAPEPDLLESDYPDLEEEFPAPVARTRTRRRKRRQRSTANWLGSALGAVGRGARALGERLLPDRAAERPAVARRRTVRARQDRAQRAPGVRWGTAVVIAIPVLAVLFVAAYTTYRNWSLQSQFNDLLEQAGQDRAIALESTDNPLVAREYWQTVLEKVGQAEELQPEREEPGELRTQALTEIDRIDGVTRLERIFKLYTYEQPASSPSRVIVAGLDVYVLDRSTERVYHHALNELRTALREPDAEQILIQQGQSVDGQSVGSLLDIAWIRDGGERQSGALIIIDRNGLLLEYDPAWEQLNTLQLGGMESWRSPIAARTFDSNLYLLDPLANQIFKYWSGKYDEPSTGWITQSDLDLSRATDLAIDGNIFVLYQDGRIIKLFAGATVSFTQKRIPIPLASATALYFDVEDVVQHMYVVDPSEARVVQLDHEGTFIRQFQPALGHESSLSQPGGAFVDETAGKLYYVATNALYVADIPTVQP